MLPTTRDCRWKLSRLHANAAPTLANPLTSTAACFRLPTLPPALHRTPTPIAPSPARHLLCPGEDDKASGRPGMPSEDMGRWVCGRDEAEARTAAEKKYPGRPLRLVQDEDVLDTW
jgi:hypothetical protein